MDSFDKFKELLGNNFEIEKTKNKYSNDIIIRYNESNIDEWMRIQIKYIEKESNTKNKVYKCKINKNFKDYLIIIVLNDKFWLIPKNDITTLTISILYTNSQYKYSKYEVKEDDICEKINDYLQHKYIKLLTKENASDYFDAIKTTLPIKDTKYTFEQISQLIEEKGCTIISKKETYKNTKANITIKLKCGHEYITTYNQFMRKCVYDCKECINKSMILNNYNHELNATNNAINEGNMICTLKEKLESYFDVVKNNESCLADMLIKPKNITENNWMAIQIKTNNSKKVAQYTFGKINKYPNMLVICIYIPIFKLWIFNGSDLIKLTTVTIGKILSKYNKYEIKPNDLIKTLKFAYETGKYNNIDIIKDTLEFLNIPRSIFSKIEHTHRLKREALFKNLYTITYPKYDNSKTDCLFNNFKIQDKTFNKKYDCSDWYNAKLPTNHYKRCDNDFYWLYTEDPNYKEKFIILSVKVLDDAKLFNENGYLKIISFSMKRNHEFHKYMFDYTKPDLVKIKELFNI